MCPLAEFQEGSEIVVDEKSVALLPGWSEPASGSDVTRIGNLVTLSMQVKNEAEDEWEAEGVYAAKAVTVREGHLFESLVAGNTGHDPKTDGGVHWKLLTETPTRVTVLPPDFRPSVTTVTADGNFSVSAEGVISAAFALTSEPGAYKVLQLSYRAAVPIP